MRTKIAEAVKAVKTAVARLAKSEPAVIVSAVVAVALSFGVELRAEDVSAIERALVVVLPLLGGAVTRSKVTPAA